MRVIAGELKGRKLASVPGNKTRPTADKVKESVFNMIGPFFSGGVALDLFAGTGALGIEALSRGMDKAVFIDADAKAVAVIKRNLQMLGLFARSEVHRNDALRALFILHKRAFVFDCVFLDPPYAMQIYHSLLSQIDELNLVAGGAKIVAESDASLTLPNVVGRLYKWREATYGGTKITIYERGE
jgi:16S rRNA (guanine(966)-N(2))-methyltransferase RsmD